MEKVVAYLRVSTKSQEAAGNGLEAQEVAIRAFAESNNLEVTDVLVEIASGGDIHRPILQAALAKAAKTGVAILVSKLDRLSRSASHVLNIVQSKARFIVASLGVDVDNFMLTIHAAVAEQERRMIGTRTKEALARVKAKGIKLGNPNVENCLRDGKVVLSLASASKMGAKINSDKADAFAESVRPVLSRMLSAGMSANAVAKALNSTGTKTARGGSWSATTVLNVQSRWV